MESQRIAEWVEQTEFAHIPDEAVAVMKNALLDTIGVIMAANSLGEGSKAFLSLAIETGGKKESTIIGFGEKVPSYMAAFANGSMVHALDFEDAHDEAGVHPNAATIPAVLALAESMGKIDGKQLLTAAIIGSELVCRMGLALTANILEYGWYTPAILGAFGATVACAKLLNLKREQILDALSLCLCQAACSAEIINNPKCLIRGVREAFGAKTGVLSAILAKKGVKGFDRPFEGEYGFFSIYARGNYDPRKLLSELGEKYECANISFKPWPSCRGTHPYIEATIKIFKDYCICPKDVKSIRVIVGERSVARRLCEPPERKRKPRTAIDAKFSIPFTVAIAAQYGDVKLEHFKKGFLKDKNLVEIARKVEHSIDPDLDWRTSNPGIVEVSLKDGRTIREEVKYPYGHPRNPISFEKLVSKFLECSSYAHRPLEDDSLREIIERVQKIEKLEDIRELTKYL